MHATMFNRGCFTTPTVRRGVKAAPQILVLMVQVRSLAAELPTVDRHGTTVRRWTASVDGSEREEVELPALDERSDAWLVGRARELLAIAQVSWRGTRSRHAGELDRLLSEVRRRGEPRMVAQVLRAAAAIRVNDSEQAITVEAESIVDEFLEHATRHEFLVLQADAHALRAKRLFLAGAEDAALTEAAVGLAMLDEKVPPDVSFGARVWDVLMASTLMDLGLVLMELGVYEVGDQVMRRANRHIRNGAGPHDVSVHLITRCRMQLGWGLRLERIGEDDQAAERFERAAAMANDVEAPFRESLFPRRTTQPAADQLPVVGAAHALAKPSPRHTERLIGLLATSAPREMMFVAIALARCLERADRADESIKVLSTVQDRLGSTAEPALLLCMIREYARLSGGDGGDDDDKTIGALQAYIAELEDQLWDMRESRAATLATRREHERLTRRHGAVAKQALQDPLTGLPNRRALDERLAELSGGRAPLAIALVDLDGFKGVNDRLSHAEGDDVLRVVASTVRDTLRTSDMVARYGGDEFIALLPGAPLHAAKAALRRAAVAVESLPADLSRGVTLSVGVVSLRPEESATRALARADAAMYQAKRKGGNDVVAVASTDGDGAEVAAEDTADSPDPAWVLPDAT
jgi:diguanylate cyclase (GGDEF)-like protein